MAETFPYENDEIRYTMCTFVSFQFMLIATNMHNVSGIRYYKLFVGAYSI